MSDQPQLFDDPTIHKPEPPKLTCTPDFVGTGPSGETCQTCRHCVKRFMGGRYYKCNLVQYRWTRGSGTDIKVRWPACSKWEAHDVYTNECIRRFVNAAKIDPPAVVTATDALVIADWYRQQDEDGPFLALAKLANDLT